MRTSMGCRSLGAAVWVAASLVGASAQGAEFGTKEEARAMLDAVVAAVKADQKRALADFTAGKGGFKDRDLYPYCGGPDGRFTAHPKLVGEPLKGLKDKTGHDFGTKIYELAKEGAVVEVPYMWPRPGETEPVEKVALVTKIGDQICAVGYYL